MWNFYKYLPQLAICTQLCPTRDRIISWGLTTDLICLKCNSAPKSRDQLSFECSYSWSTWDTWSSIAIRRFHVRFSWSNTRNHNRVWGLWAACKIGLPMCNHRFHSSYFRSINCSALIDSTIRIRISNYHDTNPRRASRMLQRWLSTSKLNGIVQNWSLRAFCLCLNISPTGFEFLHANDRYVIDEL